MSEYRKDSLRTMAVLLSAIVLVAIVGL